MKIVIFVTSIFIHLFCLSQVNLTLKKEIFELDFLPSKVLLMEHNILLVGEYYALVSKEKGKVNFVFFNKYKIIGNASLNVPKNATFYLDHLQFLEEELVISFSNFKTNKITFYRYTLENFKFQIIDQFENDSMNFPLSKRGNELWSSEVYPRKTKKESTNIQSFNFLTKQRDSHEIKHSLPIIGILKNVRNVDFGDSMYAVAQFEKYQIDFYNYNHFKINSINYADSNFVQMDSLAIMEHKKFGENYLSPNNSFTRFMDGLNEHSGIWLINFLNDNLVHLQFSNPNKKQDKFTLINHFWKNVNGQWKYFGEIKTESLLQESSLVQNEIPLLISEYGSKFLFAHNQIHGFLFGDKRINYMDNPVISEYFNSQVPKESLVLRLMIVGIE